MLRTKETERIAKTIPKKPLTARKLEYLTLAGMGFTYQEIANLLNVSLSTVKKTFEKIYEILKAVDKTHAILIACVHKLLSNELCNSVLEQYPEARKLLNQKKQKRENLKIKFSTK